MQINSDELHFLVGSYAVLENMSRTPALQTFSKRVVDFFSELSREILKDRRSRNYIDVMSYAYWIRKASIEKEKTKHPDRNNRIGRGVALHVAPSNVPVNFAVSMTSSLLAGNATMIRVSNKNFEQVDIICDAINRILCGECKDMRDYLCIIRYEHSELITQELSNLCDVRIVWGGNNTINEIRKASLPPRVIEMTFADRYSVAVINSDAYLNEDPDEVAKGFYTDTYYSDQNACSSPRLVVWMGNKVNEARELFWKKMNLLVEKDYDMKPIQAIDKFTSLSMLGMGYDGVHLVSDNNLVVRVEVDKLYPELMNYKNGGGYFFEYKMKNLDDIVPVLTKQCQTISVLGIEKQDILDIVFKYGVRGVDRVVELGKTMELEFIWDGYKMIEEMSRFIYSGGC